MVNYKVFKTINPTSEKANTPIQQKREFSYTWCEWAAKNREQLILQYGNSGAGNVSIYTIPEGFTLYVTSVLLTGIGNAAGVNILTINIDNALTGRIGALYLANGITNSCSLNFNCPLKFNSGRQIYINYGNNISFLTIVTGFLEQNQA